MSKSRFHALILVDFQNDFLNDGGRMPVSRAQAGPALAAARNAAAAARGRGDLIVAVGNEFRRNDWFMNLLRRHAAIAGTPGAAWSESLPLDGAAYFPKWAGSAFVNPDFEACLRNHRITSLTLTGVFARACVAATARDALARGYAVDLLVPAIACASDASRHCALKKLAGQGARLIESAEFHADPGARLDDLLQTLPHASAFS